MSFEIPCSWSHKLCEWGPWEERDDCQLIPLVSRLTGLRGMCVITCQSDSALSCHNGHLPGTGVLVPSREGMINPLNCISQRKSWGEEENQLVAPFVLNFIEACFINVSFIIRDYCVFVKKSLLITKTWCVPMDIHLKITLTLWVRSNYYFFVCHAR